MKNYKKALLIAGVVVVVFALVLLYINFGPLVRDVVTSLAAMVVAIVAVLGLWIWKKPLKGEIEYKLARRLLLSVYKIKYAIPAMRNPIMTGAEISAALKKAGITETGQNSHFLNATAVYVARSERVLSAFAELDMEALEAEVTWGKVVTQKLAPFRESVRLLFEYIDYSLEQREGLPRNSHPKLSEIEEVIYTRRDPSKDHFAMRLEKDVKLVEDYLKPYLKL